MKKFVTALVALILVVVISVIFVKVNKNNENTGYLRIHVRANSNLQVDQLVKYEVKEAVVDFLTPKLTKGTTFENAYKIINDNLKEIEAVANKVLKDNGFSYVSHAKLNEEYFPTRSYGDVTLENGYYDALILELGSGEGNNWWCVVYPPLCFIGAEGNSCTNIKYKSKLLEIIQKFFLK